MKLAVLAALLVTSALSPAARAETRRLAIVVGNNVGAGVRPPLRFAEDDADRLARVLEELGNFDPRDVRVLKGRSLGDLETALREVAAAIAGWRRGPDQHAVALFYFSGHSDGQSLELGADRLDFTDVRRLLAETAADVRLAIVDTCRAGGLLALKGGTPGPTFEVNVADNLSSAGEALITSSAGEESALESAEIRASFFSHHLISGLRGAADTSGDGQVSLSEAYQYAFARTVSTTATTLIGPQHPGYDFRLSGRGDLVLTRLRRPAALIETPPGFDRLLVIDPRRAEVLVELGPRAARRVAVPAGRYLLRGWQGGRLLEASVALDSGEARAVPLDLFAPMQVASGSPKGGEGFSMQVGAGLEGAVASSLPALKGVRLCVMAQRSVSPTVALDVATAGGARFREQRAELLMGLGRRWARGRWRATVGGEAGGGVATQTEDQGGVLSTPVGTVAATASASVLLGRSLGLTLTAQLPASLLRRDDRSVGLFQPAGWLGLVIEP
jgi:hypothetical protein